VARSRFPVCGNDGDRARILDNDLERANAARDLAYNGINDAPGLACAQNPQNPEDSTMPSFDIVSEVNRQEVVNAVDQANRELRQRFDFKGVDAEYALEELTITQSAPSDFQLKQMLDILRARLIARGIDARCLDVKDPEVNLARAKQKVLIVQGIEKELAKKIIARLKESKLKIDTQIQGEKLRVQGKKRDDLQAAIAVLRAADFERPLQYENFRD
jgi:uncharacterized protein YajQ (UPF0234 family)